MEKPELLEIATNEKNGSFWVVVFNKRLGYTTKRLRCEICDAYKDYLVWEENNKILHCTKDGCLQKVEKMVRGDHKLGVKIFEPV